MRTPLPLTSPLGNFTDIADLALHAKAIGAVQRAAEGLDVELPGVDVEILIVGAFARDLHLRYGYNLLPLRQTEDLDIAVAFPSWHTFAALRERLISDHGFAEVPGIQHQLRYRLPNLMLPIDIVPFGGLERPDRTIAWPPSGDEVMDVFGFREAHACAITMVLPGDVSIKVVSLAALAILKLNAWQARHYEAPRKDAYDLQFITKHYLDAGNHDRLWEEFSAWADAADFDYETAGARVLGNDAGALLNDVGRERIAALLLSQTNENSNGLLALEMNRNEPARAMELLRALHVGILESKNK
ncbi:MAG: nucleotidyl transferase AbiEii/AbiGii toxin family protein [Aeromicrobium sp.]|nr:nucleotidyl transferase AbiEii/AbiGii toxin family protein [Burkholderiales bacterium]